jgi:hypothetical protein
MCDQVQKAEWPLDAGLSMSGRSPPDDDGVVDHEAISFRNGSCASRNMNVMMQNQPISPPDEFQIDWSQSPDSARWWAVDESGESHWFCLPTFVPLAPFWYCEQLPAPAFAFNGDWRESLVERPAR